MELEIPRNSGELQSALDHSKRRIAVPIHDPVTQRTVIRPDPQTDAAFLRQPNQRGETFTDPVQFGAILFVVVLFYGEFLGIGVVPRVNPNFLDPESRFHRCFRFEMDIRDDRNIATSLKQSSFDILKILRVLHRRCGDSNNFATDVRQFHRLADAGLGVHRVTSDHRLHPDRMMSSDPHFADFDFTC